MTKIKILGSGKEVGRAGILIEENSRSVLLDYGVNFDEDDRPIFPLHVRPKDIDVVILTHSHLDHIGAAPSLYISIMPKIGATPLTLDVSKILLMDMIKLNGPYLPFDEQSVNDMLTSAETMDYEKPYEYGDFQVTLMDSGHIPGSASVLVETSNNKILYTADMNTIETKLKNPHKLNGVEADTLIIESTYSTSNHPPRDETEKRFIDDVNDVVEKGGIVLVPAFGVSRGQEIMALLEEKGFGYNIWVDGMIRDIAELYIAHSNYLRSPGLLLKAMQEQRLVKGWNDRRKALKQPGVIIASAGMMKGGPSLYYLKKLAHNPRNAVFMVSYQAEKTPGRDILETGSYYDGNTKVEVKARVEWFDFSSHTDRRGILETIKSIQGIQRVILVHGEPEGQKSLAEEIRNHNTNLDIIIPDNGDEINISNT
ncbi:putative exonuclease of the beta-lactamase fold involved in RNA processing [Caldisphaera lagunensis DSM 15908]|uniref:Putative exonuclease of the beta-lactamase fold involved in RNA processing n=1 Tax=Caldisphaera lagunensis (strain DSM 15908 / JCM 11604 / ANMR 0165 / IC-154) TaxID=1056495 RepID=L0A9S6_CALLD|nr:MBL fold metallo-hydrolase [Caldisphaera lagunensis]AFZ69810.1 putative exonuclease of the beta-lactamase fold involved in RNA processing [Caldisphaera lagunensis DSM 15908]